MGLWYHETHIKKTKAGLPQKEGTKKPLQTANQQDPHRQTCPQGFVWFKPPLGQKSGTVQKQKLWLTVH
jgi:hypothetical protein